jgi:glutathione synthase/RimK-type ligase-like ATP-grasp enzyme
LKPIALLRWQNLPRFVTWDIPNKADLHAEDDRVREGFISAGLPTESVIWRAPGIEWDSYSAAILRSPWDYIDDPAGFLDVLTRIEASSCRLFNPIEAVRWNIDKGYLFDLEERGVPGIPTYRASDAARAQAAMQREGYRHAILKPTIGAAASDSFRVTTRDLDRRAEEVARERPSLEYLIQPFIESVVEDGELSFVYFGGRLSHVLRRTPAAGDYRVQGVYGGSVEQWSASKDDVAQSDAVVAALPFDLLYARIDMIRYRGRLAVMEVELIEPIMGFDLVAEGVGRFADAARTARTALGWEVVSSQ